MAYIEDTNLIEEIRSLKIFVGGKDVFPDEAKTSVLRVICEQPTADVVEVKHGEWEKIVKDIGKGRTLTHYKCSLCGVYVSDKVNYCYHCGAKMDIDLSINHVEEKCKED